MAMKTNLTAAAAVWVLLPALIALPLATAQGAVPGLFDRGNQNFGTGVLGLCEGDCDRDDQCAGPLVCYDPPTQNDRSIPGCAGVGTQFYEYCINPPLVVIPDPGPGALEICEGDCLTDADCAGSLICFLGQGPVPGCTGTEDISVNYCVSPPPPATSAPTAATSSAPTAATSAPTAATSAPTAATSAPTVVPSVLASASASKFSTVTPSATNVPSTKAPKSGKGKGKGKGNSEGKGKGKGKGNSQGKGKGKGGTTVAAATPPPPKVVATVAASRTTTTRASRAKPKKSPSKNKKAKK